MGMGATLALPWAVNNLGEWDSVGSKPGDYSFSPGLASACGTLCQRGGCPGGSISGQSKELGLALRHLTLSG